MSSLTISLAMILFGALLVYAGWTNRSVKRLLLGDSSASSSSPAGATP